MKKFSFICITLTLCLAFAGVGLASSSPGHNLLPSVLSGGGGQSASAGHSMNDTLGQAASSVSSSGQHRLYSGYWGSFATGAGEPPVVGGSSFWSAFSFGGQSTSAGHNLMDSSGENAVGSSSSPGHRLISGYVAPFADATPDEDSDNDGVSDVEEQGPDGSDPGYDGNSDGTADSEQNNTVSTHTYNGQHYVTLASPAGTSLSDVQAIDNPSPGDQPSGVDFPCQFFEFTVDGLDPGGTVDVTLFLPPGLTITEYYKYGPTPANATLHWYLFDYDGTTGAEIAGNIITLHFVDALRGDYDLTANGEIVEPGGPASMADNPPYTSDHNPADGDIAVPVDTDIVVHILDDESGVDVATISMTVEVESVSVPGTLDIAGTSSEYILTFNPDADFDNLQVVDVTVDASDLAGNAMTTDSYSFTTQAGGALSEVWVDDDWATGYLPGDPVDGHTFGVDAFASIQDGIDAVSGSTVHVADGTYIENIEMKSGVEILGSGTPTCTIDGDGISSVVTAIDVDDTARLDGFTITNGTGIWFEHQGFEEYWGGGICIENANPVINNCAFVNNTAGQGGGMALYGSSPTITSCTIAHNTATWYGGGIVLDNDSSPEITDCVIEDNHAVDMTGSAGGGIASDSSSPILNNCEFRENTTQIAGGGMANLDSLPVLTNCTFVMNEAIVGFGGGMFNIDSSPELSGCVFEGNIAQATGGGMQNLSDLGVSAPTLIDCTFSSNSAGSGGGMDNVGSPPIVTNCIFENNSATTENGGGMHNNSSSPEITACSFDSNVANNSGGAVFNNNSSPTVTTCIFINNSATNDSGGGICNLDSSSPEITDCDFTDNEANSGGGMFNSSSTPTVTACNFVNNSAITYDGGGMYNMDPSSPEIIDCTFSGNTANNSGGGMFNNNSSPILTNCILTNNSTTNWIGGAIGNWNTCSPMLINCTLYGNSASDGDGISCDSAGSTITVQITNCILWNGGNELYNFDGGSFVVTYSDVQDSDPDDTNIYPGLGNIDDNPIFVDAVNNDLHLQAISPCIDVGDNSVPGLPATDFEGDDRIIDGNGDETATVDMGADEFLPPITNTPPIAVDDNYTVSEGMTLDANDSDGTTGDASDDGVLANDTDDDGDILTASLATGPSNASSFALNSDGTFAYTHDGLSTSPDSFIYEVSDSNGGLATGTATIIIIGNQAPEAINDSYTVVQGGTIDTIADSLEGVLFNDTDANGDLLTVSEVNGSSADVGVSVTLTNGTLNLSSDGSFTYVHDGSDTTSDSFTYKANDGTDDSNLATVSITINPAVETISLFQGWNFVSVPAKLDNSSCEIQQVFPGIDTDGNPIYLYDNGTWNQMAASDIFMPLDGIWIYSMSSEDAVLIFDTNPVMLPPTKDLELSWNAIGHSSKEPVNANSTLYSVESKWAYLIGFDASSQNYEPAIINNHEDGSAYDEDNPMHPTKGYWLFMTEPGLLGGISLGASALMDAAEPSQMESFMMNSQTMSAQSSSSSPQLPKAYYGSITVGSFPAPAGSEIIAMINGNEKGSLITTEVGIFGGPGTYDSKLIVAGDEYDVGREVTLWVNGVQADQTDIYDLGTTASLALTIPADEEYDFGDAPDPTYPTMLSSDGARHVTVNHIYLGSSVDAESDGQPTNEDDTTGAVDDEDGITFVTELVPSQLATVEVEASIDGYLNAWIDFNGDGAWSGTNEQIFTNESLDSGTNILDFQVPQTTVTGVETWARFRFTSTDQVLSFTGLAPDGEVEDYPISPVPELPTIVLMGIGLITLGGFIWYRRCRVAAIT